MEEKSPLEANRTDFFKNGEFSAFGTRKRPPRPRVQVRHEQPRPARDLFGI